jgi:dihydroxyacetone kinase
MLDALCPALSAARSVLEQQTDGWAALQAASEAAMAGAAATRAMAPRAGRASYRAEAGLLSADDPGATAVALVLAAAAAQAAEGWLEK